MSQTPMQRTVCPGDSRMLRVCRWIDFSEGDGITKSPEAQLSAAETDHCQRVEDNAFHLFRG